MYIFEDEQFRDEPLSGDPTASDEYDYAYLDHIYTYDLPETKDVILAEQYAAVKDYGADRVDMLESYESPENSRELFDISDFPFNMMFIEDGEGHIYGENWPGADNVLSVINRVLDNVPEGRSPSWVVSLTYLLPKYCTSMVHQSGE